MATPLVLSVNYSGDVLKEFRDMDKQHSNHFNLSVKVGNGYIDIESSSNGDWLIKVNDVKVADGISSRSEAVEKVIEFI